LPELAPLTLLTEADITNSDILWPKEAWMSRSFVLLALVAGVPLPLFAAADAQPQFRFQARVVADAQYPFALRLNGAIGRMDVLQQTAPQYPIEAMNAGIEGDVTVAIVVGVDGRVLGARPVAGNPVLAPAAVGAVKQWIYQPVVRGGEAMEVEGVVTVPFRLPAGLAKADAMPGVVKRISFSHPNMAPAGTPHQPIRLTGPVLLSKTEPNYPFAERAAVVNGIVGLTLTIGADGLAKDVQVAQSLDPVLDRNALAALSQWRFAPARQDGVPVEITVSAEIYFQQEGPGPSLSAFTAQSDDQSASTVTLQVEMPPNGTVMRFHVLRSVGFGFDERAIEAAKQWLEQGDAVGAGREAVIQVEFN
jgi:TonB family protein